MHCIRLRAPWDERVVGHEPGVPRRHSLTRRFGRPTGLEPDQRVWLVVQRCPPPQEPSRDDPPPAQLLTVTLNGQILAELPLESQLGRWEIAARLQPRNELVLEYDGAGKASERQTSPPDWIGDVRLEIEPAGTAKRAGERA